MNGQNKPKLQRTKTYRNLRDLWNENLEEEEVEEEGEFKNLNIDKEFKKNNEELKRSEKIEEYREIYSEEPRVKSSNGRGFDYGH
jgi:hypothetical protein